MKRTIALILALMLVLLAGCGQAAPAPAAASEPTPQPTPEPTHVIPMSGLLTDVLDSERQSFMTGLKKTPPSMAVIKLGDQAEAVVLDIDDVRRLCSLLLEAELTAKTDEAGDRDSTITLVKEDGKSCALDFSGDKLKVDNAYYQLADADGLRDFAEKAAEELASEAAQRKTAIGTEDFYKATYKNEKDANLMRIVSEAAVPGEDGQSVTVKLGVTNTAQHILMSAKLIASYVDTEGRVVASVPVDLDFNSAPVYIYETRDYELSQPVYSAAGVEPADIVGVLIEIVSVNAPNEAGH